eukprot:Blabericola_migrator_1__10751@NODE_615_length_7273_cov_113_689564_g448_i0_p1_GENE_NODE_615_length_7273_cov_113_689564_g448_i0NODE_615_length_7273_cov_113_689564_g448_i0_p1_ORF_typecomplete_len1053_score197_08ANAPC4_WD40/PF12894_7/1_8e02ANAPC4_WD40/PF12894_7/2_7e14ANAPC4_WD40/PF12894_7/0_23ANAPC4_WD40/PF12894_7/22ANAPC4_WD40/PF12894_7/0_051ANAPC4_WD40/PF12894_7/3e05ANAPC4_WD40/PF12894_7/1_9e09ANAPC4_WD40/PF12894_7/0_23ANAPC4_WD40/PF12894_7/0_038ANAPC4_WD40/PF12894_7/77WD40/PF00400_32/5_2WD40/PF00
MVAKAYLIYQHLDTVGVVASPECNIEACQSQDVCFSGANEAIAVWDLVSGNIIKRLTPTINYLDTVPVYDTVNRLLVNPVNSSEVIAAYSDGRVRIWDWKLEKVVATLNGHRGVVKSLAVSMDGQLLATGGSDGDIILWRLHTKEGKVRLTAHETGVTHVSFLHPSKSGLKVEDMKEEPEVQDGYKRFSAIPFGLVSTGIDGMIKLWDLETESCTQAISSHSTAAIHCALLTPSETEIILGFSHRNLEVFSISPSQDGGARLMKLKLQYIGNLDRINAAKRCNMFSCLSLEPAEVPMSLLTWHKSGLLWLPSGVYLSPQLDEFYVPDLKRVIMVTSFQNFAEVILMEDRAGQKRRELRILARRVQKLKKKMTAIETNKSIDAELKKVLGKNWMSTQADFEDRKLSRIERGIELLKEVILEKREVNGVVGKKRKQIEDEDDAEEVSSILAETSSSSVKFRLLKEKFDFLYKGISIFSRAGSQILVGTDQNRFEAYKMDLRRFWMKVTEEEADEYTLVERVSLNRRMLGVTQSLPKAATSLMVTHDDTMLVSLYMGGLVVWDIATMTIKHHFQLADFKPLCGICLAGNQHLVIGGTKGLVSLFDISTSEIIWSKQLSTTSIVAMSMHPDHKSFGFIDASNRLVICSVKLNSKTQQLAIKVKRETDLPEAPTCLCFSPNGEMLAVGLKDHTIQVMYADTFKPHLTLYGHSLPVTSVCFTTDNQMLASGSMDRHIKVWDAEFGNILRSLPASRHAALTRVQFVYDTHYVISTLTSGETHLFDCDTGTRICTLQAGRSALHCLATTADAELIFTAAEDGSIKSWERTDKQLLLSEEREREETMRSLVEAATSDVNLPGAATKEVTVANRASKKDVETIRDTERLVQVLDQAFTEVENQKGYKESVLAWQKSPLRSSMEPPEKPTPQIELLGRTPCDHVIHNVGKIAPEQLVETILGLPYKSAVVLLDFMLQYLEAFCALMEDKVRKCMAPLMGREVEIACRIALTLVQAHGRVLVSSEATRTLLTRLNVCIKQTLDFQLVRGWCQSTTVSSLHCRPY